MKAVIQRVSEASVSIEGEPVAVIQKGLLVLIGIEETDTENDMVWICHKIVNLRIFDDEKKVPNISVKDCGGNILLVSQFTLQASVKKGNRPSYIKAARPQTALPIYEKMIAMLETEMGKEIGTGSFGAEMKVSLINEGPFTILMDSKNPDL